MEPITFYIVDVFGEQKYQGNQLAVFRGTADLTQDQLQQIAKETNFAETTFIVSDEQAEGGYNVRIFTPDTEVPFAGHPTLGTAYIIHHELEQGASRRVNLNLAVGQIPVLLEDQQTLWMQQKPPQFGRTVDAAVIADILGLNPEALDQNYPVQEVSTGLPSIIVPLRSLADVQQCQINHSAYKKFLKEEFPANLLVFCKETVQDNNDLHVRVFCDDSGFPEDAATGSANGNLAGYLLQYNYFGSSELEYRVEQGYQIGRNSLLSIRASKSGDGFEINVGGQVFPVAKGEWYID